MSVIECEYCIVTLEKREGVVGNVAALFEFRGKSKAGEGVRAMEPERVACNLKEYFSGNRGHHPAVLPLERGRGVDLIHCEHGKGIAREPVT